MCVYYIVDLGSVRYFCDVITAKKALEDGYKVYFRGKQIMEITDQDIQNYYKSIIE